jgi:hypothetical protein
MDLRGFLTCVLMWLCSTDGYNAIQYARHYWRFRTMAR